MEAATLLSDHEKVFAISIVDAEVQSSLRNVVADWTNSLERVANQLCTLSFDQKSQLNVIREGGLSILFSLALEGIGCSHVGRCRSAAGDALFCLYGSREAMPALLEREQLQLLADFVKCSLSSDYSEQASGFLTGGSKISTLSGDVWHARREARRCGNHRSQNIRVHRSIR